jgi:uncharacterized protein (TIGR03435 family)
MEGTTMYSVADLLSLPQGRTRIGRVIQDRTGLTGRYKMTLDYQFTPPRPIVPTAPPDLSQPSLATAIREQWGLKLEPAKGKYKLFVVDDAQRPSEN